MQNVSKVRKFAKYVAFAFPVIMFTCGIKIILFQNPLTVASPVIDVIDMDTFQYRPSSSQLKGGEAGW